MTQEYIVQLEEGVWLAPWSGDPGRTLVQESAKRYGTKRGASLALREARKCRPFANARVVPVEEPGQ